MTQYTVSSFDLLPSLRTQYLEELEALIELTEVGEDRADGPWLLQSGQVLLVPEVQLQVLLVLLIEDSGPPTHVLQQVENHVFFKVFKNEQCDADRSQFRENLSRTLRATYRSACSFLLEDDSTL